MSEVQYFTEEGLEKLKKEYEHLMKVERPQASQAVARAREKGDLSENAEYDAAREAQGLLEMRISKLEDVLTNARIIDKNSIDTSKVTILSRVKVKNHKLKKEFTYTLVSEKESNIKEMKISVKSPIGEALLGNKVGDKVDIKTPGGMMTLEILDISL